MDENTLNDLLECSVCLERLNTTSKVLPCQHTFCRACLEVIVASHNELRCPECRVLVEVKIDELPPNVLLMRILEGLKNSTISGGKAINEQQDKEKQNQQLAPQKPQQAPQSRQQQPTQTQLNTQRRCLLPHAYALYDFESSEPTDLHFKKGDLILLKHKIDTNWYVGQLNGVEGTFPSNYVQVMAPLPTPQAIALYDFKMQPNEEEGCLNFKKGALVHVLRRVDQNWAEGRIGNAIGIFPIAFVELNALAKKLLERVESKTPLLLAPSQAQQQQLEQQLQPSNANARNLPPIPLLDPTTNTSDTTTSPSSSSSPSTHSNTTTSPSASENQNAAMTTNNSSSSNLSTNSNSLPNTPQHYAHAAAGGSVRYRNGREKRHSLNALLLNGGNPTPGLSILQTNRHSAEILSIPSEELVVGASENLTGAAMPQSSAAREQRNSATLSAMQSTTQQQQQQSTTTRANVLKTACGPTNVPSTLPWGYLALYPYKPRKSDELELKKGCVYIVTERCLDGWFKGKNWQDISGVFPGNYVTPLRARDQQQLMHQWKFVPTQTLSQPLVNNPSTATHTLNLNQAMNSNLNCIQDQAKAFPKPPELPPRHAATTTTCASVWTKPLSHTVEAFFNRGNSSTKNEEKTKDKETKSKDSNSSGAVSLMKRLTHIKSRAKSPGAIGRNTAGSPTTAAAVVGAENAATVISNRPAENTLQASTNLQPVHIRSGSCPSQLLQNLPQNPTNAANPQTQQHQQHKTNHMNHGSERIKGHKERPRIQAARQSMDGTLRGGIYANMNSNPTAATITSNFQLNPKCGQQFQMQQQQFLAMPQSAHHRKSHSLDANNVLSAGMTNSSALVSAPAPPLLPPPQMSMPNCNITAAAVVQSATTKSAHCGRESRFRCIVPYPPNSDVELELHVGDIIYVQRKQKNGWYKGTHARTQKTGLFPASFVEPDL